MAAAPIIIGGTVVGLLSERLLEVDEEESPLEKEKPSSRSQRGTYIPTIVGTGRTGAFMAWRGNRREEEEPAQGGKGGTPSPGNQKTYFEDGIDFVCVGPVYEIRNIYINGNKVKLPDDKIIIDDTPSGTTVTISREIDDETFFEDIQVFWGEASGPLDLFAGDAGRMKVQSSWPFLFHVNWLDFRLGGFASWPSIEYEIGVKPFGTLLTNAANWLAAPDEGEDRPIAVAINDTANGKIRIAGNYTNEFLPDRYCKISGQPQSDGLYLIKSSEFIDNLNLTTYNDNDDVIFRAAYNNIANWTNGTGGYSTTKQSVPQSGEGGMPAGNNFNQDVLKYKITHDFSLTDQFGKIIDTFEDSDSGQGNTFSLRRFKIQKEIYIKPVETFGGTSEWAHMRLGFRRDGTAGYFEEVKGVDIIPSSDPTVPSLSFHDGGTGSIQAAGNGWFRIDINYISGDFDSNLTYGAPASNDQANFVIQVLNGFTTGKASYLIVLDALPEDTDSYIRINEGTTTTGGTEIVLNEPLISAINNVGNITGYIDGNGESSANPAHLLAQLLFETYPHGAGLDTQNWDLQTFEDLAFLAEQEGLRSSIFGQNGASIASKVADICQELHLALTFDKKTEKYGVYPMRAVTDTSTLPVVPQEALTDAYPEQERRFDYKPSQVIFKFKNIARKMKEDTFVLSDDVYSIENNTETKNISLKTVTDIFLAATIAKRKELEINSAQTKYKFTMSRDAVLLRPGQQILVENFPFEGEEEVLIVGSVKPSNLSGTVEVEAATDVLSLGTDDAEVLGGSDQGTSSGTASAYLSGAPDLQTVVWELPPALSDDKISIFVPRIASSPHNLTAEIWLSTDNLSYRKVGFNTAAFGATLNYDIQENTRSNIQVHVTQAGYRNLSDLPSLSDDDFQRGRNVAYLNGEILYVKSALPDGVGGYVLDMIRERAVTTKAAHSEGDYIYIFKSSEIKPISDVLISSNKVLYVKTRTAGTTLADSTMTSRTIIGIGIRPLSPVALRTENKANFYKTGQDVVLKWGYYHPEAIKHRTGAGNQRGGEKREEPLQIPGLFRLTFYDGSTELRQVETRNPYYTYKNADIQSDAGSEPTITVEIEQIQNGYKSTATTLVVEKI
jgi:hypothetical protein